MGQIYMGRENPFRALVPGLTVDEFLLFREAVDKKCYRNEVGFGRSSSPPRPIGWTQGACGAVPGGASPPRPESRVGDTDNNDAASVFDSSAMSDTPPQVVAVR